MTDLNHAEYYRARAVASRLMARTASDPHIAKIHGEFARHYEAAAESRPGPKLGFARS